MKKTFLTLILCYFSMLAFAENIEYKLSMSKPSSHYYEVEMKLEDFNDKYIDVKMPVWAPGSYLVREFAKGVNLVTAKNGNGNDLKVDKINKNTWRVFSNKSGKVTVNYQVYSFELSVRTSFLDDTHGYLNGTSVFMYVDGHKNDAGKLRIIPHTTFKKITTALPKAGESTGEGTMFQFEDYDQLADSPIEIGNQIEFDFTASGVHHTVAMYGIGNYDIPTLQKDMARIVNSATNVFGENPNKEYTFIIHNTVDGGGGLEHKNSTTLNVNRWTYSGDEYIGFLSLVAHEYFHLWNVKRIRPVELGPFNYDEENHTSLLWVMEGFTSYYDELLLRRAGYYSEEEYMIKLRNTITYVERFPGNKVQPVSHASHDAWIKSYRPNENSRNTTISYYSKGQVLAAVIDMQIIDAYNGKKSLDDFMQLLYKKYYKKKDRGFSDEEFKMELSKFMKKDLTSFYADYVDGTKTIPYASYFKLVDVQLNEDEKLKNNVGVSVKSKSGNAIISLILADSDGQTANLNVNDEIIAIDGFRADKSFVDSYLASLVKGDKVSLLTTRDDLIRTVELTVTDVKYTLFTFGDIEKDSKKFKYWLRLQ